MINYKELKKYIHQYKPGDIYYGPGDIYYGAYLHNNTIEPGTGITTQKPGGYAFIPPLSMAGTNNIFKYGSKRSMIKILEWLISWNPYFAINFTTKQKKL